MHKIFWSNGAFICFTCIIISVFVINYNKDYNRFLLWNFFFLFYFSFISHFDAWLIRPMTVYQKWFVNFMVFFLFVNSNFSLSALLVFRRLFSPVKTAEWLMILIRTRNAPIYTVPVIICRTNLSKLLKLQEKNPFRERIKLCKSILNFLLYQTTFEWSNWVFMNVKMVEKA